RESRGRLQGRFRDHSTEGSHDVLATVAVKKRSINNRKPLGGALQKDCGNPETDALTVSFALASFCRSI
ncbi:MAG: hypothetical protein QOF56_2991, partial [Acidobacteriaceae bacterium]|nr:hypothetical protein [Acidobacteriaceae bacterium]